MRDLHNAPYTFQTYNGNANITINKTIYKKKTKNKMMIN